MLTWMNHRPKYWVERIVFQSLISKSLRREKINLLPRKKRSVRITTQYYSTYFELSNKIIALYIYHFFIEAQTLFLYGLFQVLFLSELKTAYQYP